MERDNGANVLWRSASTERLLTDEWGAPPFRIAVPGDAMREASSVADLGLWYAIGDVWAQLAAGLLPQGPASVLDLGCSCAKVGRFLTYNPNVTYIGLDVFRPAIDWCRRAFADVPRFTFHHLDVMSSLYNPRGAMLGSQVTLPVAAGSIDVIIAGSLFTHLLENDFKRYLAETGRCLNPDGAALVSLHLSKAALGVTGDEVMIEIGEQYFAELATDAKLRIAKEFRNIFGQTVYVLKRET